MDRLLGLGVFVAFATGVLLFIRHEYARLRPPPLERGWDLPPGELVMYRIIGEPPDGNPLVTGQPAVMFAITSRGRLLVRRWNVDHMELHAFAPGAAAITRNGRIVRIAPRDGTAPFEARVQASDAPVLASWA